MVVVLRDKVVALAKALDFQAAGSWNKATMREKLPKIARVAKEDGTKVDDPELQALLEVLIDEEGVVDIAKDEDDLKAQQARLEGVQAGVAAAAKEDAERKAEVAEAEANGTADEVEPPVAPEEPKKGKKDKAPKAPKPPKAEKPPKVRNHARPYFVGVALAKHGIGKEMTDDEIAAVKAEAERLYVAAGGKGNPARMDDAFWSARHAADGIAAVLSEEKD